MGAQTQEPYWRWAWFTIAVCMGLGVVLALALSSLTVFFLFLMFSTATWTTTSYIDRERESENTHHHAWERYGRKPCQNILEVFSIPDDSELGLPALSLYGWGGVSSGIIPMSDGGGSWYRGGWVIEVKDAPKIKVTPTEIYHAVIPRQITEAECRGLFPHAWNHIESHGYNPLNTEICLAGVSTVALEGPSLKVIDYETQVLSKADVLDQEREGRSNAVQRAFESQSLANAMVDREVKTRRKVRKVEDIENQEQKDGH